MIQIELKHWWCAWHSNPGLQDSRRRRNHEAMEAIQQFYLFGQIQTSQTGGQDYSDTSPYGENVFY